MKGHFCRHVFSVAFLAQKWVNGTRSKISVKSWVCVSGYPFGYLCFAVGYEMSKRLVQGTVEPRFNEPLYNEVLGITNNIFQPSNSVTYGKEP